MSSAPSPATPAPPARPKDPDSLTIVSHSQLVYWWPVWAFGFLFGLMTFFEGSHMAVVPHNAEAWVKADLITVRTADGTKDFKDKAVIFANEIDLPVNSKDKSKYDLRLHVSERKGLGVLYCIILLLVVIITNVPLRGLWSVIAIVGVILVALILQLAQAWGTILEYFSLLDIRINAGGYIFFSTLLFIIWVVVITVFDRQLYIVFTPGQLKVCTEIGGGEKVYDAFGLHMEKQRSDLFRHWILGLGSGDLIVKTGGASPHQFDLPNVLFIGRKVAQIEQLIKKKTVDVKD